MSFDLKPSRIGLPYHGLVTDKVLPVPNNADIILTVQPPARNILMNKARDAATVVSTDADQGFDFKDRLLIPSLVNLSADEIIFLDSVSTPYVVKVEVIKDSAFVVRVKATLRHEFGRFYSMEPRASYDIVFCDEVVSLADASDASYSSINGLDGELEQSPSGENVLLNISGNFGNAGDNYEVKTGCRKLAGVIDLSITGTVGPAGSGLSGSLSLHKSAADCSPAYSESTTDTRSLVHWTLEEIQSFTGIGASAHTHPDVQLNRVHMHFEAPVLEASGASSIGIAGNDDKQLNTGLVKKDRTQNLIFRSHFDNNGATVDLGVNLIHNNSVEFTNSTAVVVAFDYYVDEYDYDGTYAPASRDSVNNGSISNETTTMTRTDVTVTYNLYKAELTVNLAVKEEKVYSHKLTNSRGVTDGDFGNFFGPGGGYAGEYVFGSEPSTKEAVSIGSAAYIGSKGINDVLLPAFDNYDSNGYPTTDINTYDVDNWGDITSGATPVENQEFNYFSLNVIDGRFCSLTNTNKVENSKGHSVFGSTALNHLANISYDPYSDVITDSDTPIGYV